MQLRKWIVAGGLLGIVILVLALGRGRERGAEIEVGRAEQRQQFQSFVNVSGEIVAERFADVGSSVMGKVVELPVTEGQEVSEGSLLARIDPVQARSEVNASEAAIRALSSEVQAAIKQVESSLAELDLARARSREAMATFERQQSLFEQRLISVSELDIARSNADSGEAQTRAAQAAVAIAESRRNAAERRVAQAGAQGERARDILDKTAIVAPISGVVSRLQVREGEMVVIGIQNQPGTVLMTVSDLSELNAEVRVAEADVLRLAVGQEASVTLEAIPERSFRGRVTEVGASALPQLTTAAAAREFRVEIRLEEQIEGMRPGLTCDAEILVGEKDAVTVVPLQSVVLRDQAADEEVRGVFVVEDGRARFTPVETGIIGGLDIEVIGIASGTEIVIGPYQTLRELSDGQKVRVR